MMPSITRSKDRGDTLGQATWQIRAAAIVTAVITNMVILTAGRIFNGDFPVAKVGDDDQSIEFPQVIVVTMLIGLVAWGLLMLLERTTARAASIWLAVATVFFLISLAGPFAQGDNTSSKVVLALLHVGTFVSVVPLLRRSGMEPRA